MTGALVSVGPPDAAVYALVFGAAAVACVAATARARTIEDDDTRRGLVALTLTTGGWAAAHVGVFLAPTADVALVFYYVGLVVGFASVGPWLYFCSAYTGRTLHRSPAVRRLAVGVFLFVVALKVTNPIHGLYFRASYVAAPFPHLAVENLALHWVAMGLAYALATIGYFMLVEMFWQVDHDARPLLGLVAVTGLPLVLDVVGRESDLLVDITYEPLGVAAFAIGVLFVFLEDFRTIQLTGMRDEPVILLDDDDRVRDYNRAAGELFADLERNVPVGAVVPEGTADLEADPVVEITHGGSQRYYQIATNSFAADASKIGRVLMFTDITERESYRTELERQNERLESFASMVSHDLRNPLNVAQGQLELARERHDDEALEVTSTSLERMETLIEDLLALARQGQPIDETERVELSTVAERAWQVVDTRSATLERGDGPALEADPDRLQQLLENLFRNAVDHGGDDVAVRVGPLPEGRGFYVADDGPGIPEADRDDVFESGFTTDQEGTGFGLAIVAEIVEAHGWSVAVTEGEDGGARFEIETGPA